MPLSFNEIPADARTPYFYLEFDGSASASPNVLMPWRTLLVGTPEKPDAVAASVPARVTSSEQAAKLYGKSELTSMVRAFFNAGSPTLELWCLPVADAAKAPAAFDTTEDWWKVVAVGFSVTAAITAISQSLQRRSGADQQQDGVLITGVAGDVTALTAYGALYNSQSLVVVPCPTDVEGARYAAAFAAVIALAGGADPARPFQTLPVPGITASAGFKRADREALLRSGVSTWTRDVQGNVFVERLITTYKKNAAGADDFAYYDLNSVLTLSYLRYSFRTYFLTKYPRHKLADDEARFGPGQAVLTPKLARAEAIAWYRAMETEGLVEGGDAFVRELRVERDTRDRNRLNFLLPSNLINQFVVGAAKIAFAA